MLRSGRTHDRGRPRRRARRWWDRRESAQSVPRLRGQSPASSRRHRPIGTHRCPPARCCGCTPSRCQRTRRVDLRQRRRSRLRNPHRKRRPKRSPTLRPRRSSSRRPRRSRPCKTYGDLRPRRQPRSSVRRDADRSSGTRDLSATDRRSERAAHQLALFEADWWRPSRAADAARSVHTAAPAPNRTRNC